MATSMLTAACRIAPLRWAQRAAALLCLAAAALHAAEMPTALEAGPYLTGLAKDRITISWQTHEPTTGGVECLVAPEEWRFGDSARAARVHHVTLTGLPPATRCSYRVLVGPEATPFFTFRTAPAKPEPVRFAVYGDTRSNPKYHARVAQAVRAHRPAFVLHTGDYATDGRERAQWVQQFFTPAAELLRECPILPVMGTHERNFPAFYDYFAPPRDLVWLDRVRGDPLAARAGGAWFAWSYGEVDFFILNCYLPTKADSPQVRWLADALAASRGAWRIAAIHEPFFSSGDHGGAEKLRETLLPLLLQGGVDVVFAGHEHLYERTVALSDGDEATGHALVEIVAGGGGVKLHKVRPGGPWSAYATSQRHFCIVGVEGDALVVTAYSETHEPIDTLVLAKRGGRRDFGPTVPVTALEFLSAAKRFSSFSFPNIRAAAQSKEFSFSVSNPYHSELWGELTWKAAGRGWTLEPAEQSVRVPPGGKATVKFKAMFDPEAEGSAAKPAPEAVMTSGGRTVTVPAFNLGAVPKPRERKPADPDDLLLDDDDE